MIIRNDRKVEGNRNKVVPASVIEFASVREVLAYGPAGHNNRAKYPLPRPASPRNKSLAKEVLENGNRFRQDTVSWLSGGQVRYYSELLLLSEELAFTGWKEGAEKIREFGKSLKLPTPKNVMPELLTQRLHGQRLDVARYISGNRDCFGRWTKESKERTRNIRIIINSYVSSAEGQKDTFLRGLASLTLADMLDQAGYSTEIDCIFPAFSESISEGVYCTVSHVKMAHEPLNLARAAALCSNIIIQRGGMFWAALVGDVNVDSGFGCRLTDIGRKKLSSLGITHDDEDFIIMDNPRSEKECKDMIAASIKKIEEGNLNQT